MGILSPLFLGSVGAALILLAFFLNQVHVWRDSYFIYDFVNFVGGLLLLWYALVGEVWPFVVLNGVWTLVSLRDCIADINRNAHKKKGIRFWHKLTFWEKWME